MQKKTTTPWPDWDELFGARVGSWDVGTEACTYWLPLAPTWTLAQLARTRTCTSEVYFGIVRRVRRYSYGCRKMQRRYPSKTQKNKSTLAILHFCAPPCTRTQSTMKPFPSKIPARRRQPAIVCGVCVVCHSSPPAACTCTLRPSGWRLARNPHGNASCPHVRLPGRVRGSPDFALPDWVRRHAISDYYGAAVGRAAKPTTCSFCRRVSLTTPMAPLHMRRVGLELCKESISSIGPL